MSERDKAERAAKRRKRELKNDLLQAVAEVNVLMRLIEVTPDMQANLSFTTTIRSDRHLEVKFRDY